MKTKKFFLPVLLCIPLLLSLLFIHTAFASETESYPDTIDARPSVNGMLHVDGGHLVDKDGNRVVLRGLSTHGLTWYPEFVNEGLFKTLSGDWGCNLIRLAAYSDVYAHEKNGETLDLVRTGIDAAIANDMYVLVDWHVLEEKDPHVNMKFAKTFFNTICSEYPNCPNIIFEICNEPNGETTWSDVKDYANQMIPFIRNISPENVILVGTPEYDKNLTAVSRSPVDFDNIMYVLHFYAGTHKSDLQAELRESQMNGLPVFISECGISESSGDGVIDYNNAAVWFDLLRSYGMSYTVWSISNKNESSALFKTTYDAKTELTIDDLSPAGLWVRSLIQGEDPYKISIPKDTTDRTSLPAQLISSLNPDELMPLFNWKNLALYIAIILAVLQTINIIYVKVFDKNKTYADIRNEEKDSFLVFLRRSTLFVSLFFSILYLTWRIMYSIPKDAGVLPIVGNILLLIVEIIGFIESIILYANLMHMDVPPLPKIEDSEFPDVDIFIATYNEPEELLRKTINGCNHMSYPDKSKVHIWICDDNRRASMRKLAEEMGVGYFDRPDNKGAKAGNLNNALSKTSAPYIVTFDADMIPQKGFLLNTIPYFVDAKKKETENGGVKLGLLQTPQCFYQPDVFQRALFSEKTAPNEQDFFYRSIEVAKTSTNSVIYGGSNTILSREALEAIGGFYTKSITEDFATGLLIESKGFVSLAIPTPYASGMAPSTYQEHIQQRQRWGRGVVGTAKQLKLLTRPGLSIMQRASYLSSVVYWYSPVKTLIYLASPLLFAAFMIPMFKCSWADLLLYWFPMFIMQDITLRVFSGNAISLKWSGIYETSVMPYLLIPIIKETFGMTASKFLVTDKSGKGGKKKKTDYRLLAPFLVLIVLSVWGIFRSIYVLSVTRALGIVVLLFWLIRNLYYLVMSVFLVDGRDSDSETVKVIDAEMVTLNKINHDKTLSPSFYGVTTYMTEHSMRVFLDEASDLFIGDKVKVVVEKDDTEATVTGILTSIITPRHSDSSVYAVEIIDMEESELEYLEIIYDRIPTLPQSLRRDLGIIRHMLVNIAHRILD
ncbi:MAG: cellulase family glycosylhydrolase [Lachnospiraceae bacterium]|nr:cellulase family glycosylhydrolase [Lachnospiraceae bacterium]